ncbi:MAG: hypothetical protein OYK82_04335 [Gammaproteobacteria bacterium]|nr:hypothetical protein [Gammaproteobacteria bacterium]
MPIWPSGSGRIPLRRDLSVPAPDGRGDGDGSTPDGIRILARAGSTSGWRG